jgi:hypothetical protein
MFAKTDIEKYFTAEKQESLLFIVVGIIAIIMALAFFFYWKTTFYKGAAIPLLVIGLIQAIVGLTVYSRSDNQRIENVYAYDMDPGKLKTQELPRMKTVNKNFVFYRWVELFLILVGLILVFIFRNHEGSAFWYGLGITLAIQSAIMLGADYLAEKRAIKYSTGLEIFVNKS